jgi:glycosyltransferase involved in cell wall biosynthesis
LETASNSRTWQHNTVPVRKPIRILHIFGRMARGGAEIRTLELLRHLDPAEYHFEFCALSGKPGDLDSEIRRLGGKVHLMKLSPPFARRFRRLLKQGEFYVIHSHVHYSSGFLLRIAAQSGIPRRIAHFRTANDGKGTGSWRRTRNSILKHWIDSFATDILGVSRAALDGSIGADWRRDPRCKVIYNGIDGSSTPIEPDRAGVRAEFAIPPEAALVIHVGGFKPEKNHDRLLKIFANLSMRLPHAYLLLAGAGHEPVLSSVRRLVRELSLTGRVIECGERSDASRLLHASDVMIFPSRREGLPGAVLEAAAAGTPVLASDLPPMIEISNYLPIRTMPLASSDDAWSAAVIDLCQDNALRERLTSAFRLSPFTIPRSVAAFEQVYRSS